MVHRTSCMKASPKVATSVRASHLEIWANRKVIAIMSCRLFSVHSVIPCLLRCFLFWGKPEEKPKCFRNNTTSAYLKQGKSMQRQFVAQAKLQTNTRHLQMSYSPWAVPAPPQQKDRNRLSPCYTYSYLGWFFFGACHQGQALSQAQIARCNSLPTSVKNCKVRFMTCASMCILDQIVCLAWCFWHIIVIVHLRKSRLSQAGQGPIFGVLKNGTPTSSNFQQQNIRIFRFFKSGWPLIHHWTSLYKRRWSNRKYLWWYS